jgi:hypothetical protein
MWVMAKGLKLNQVHYLYRLIGACPGKHKITLKSSNARQKPSFNSIHMRGSSSPISIESGSSVVIEADFTQPGSLSLANHSRLC